MALLFGLTIVNPIRITYDTSAINNPTLDENQCVIGNESVYFNNEETLCTPDDVITPLQKDALLKTLDNAAKFCASFIYVEPITDDITTSFEDNNKHENHQDLYVTLGNTDLLVIVVTRPCFEDSAPFLSMVTNTTDGRPIGGYFAFAVQHLPDSPSDQHSEKDSLFWTIMHENIHLFGFYQHATWKDYPDGFYRTVADPLKHDQDMALIHTKHVLEEAKRLFGDDAQGIQIETGIDDFSDYSHIKSRDFHFDFLSSQGLLGQKFTTIAIAILKDIGYYTIGKVNAEPPKPFTPYVAPHNLTADKCQYANEPRCYSPKYTGSCSHVQEVECIDEDDIFQDYKELDYILPDAKKLTLAPSLRTFDYSPIILAVGRCSEKSYCAVQGTSPACFEMTYSGDTLRINGDSGHVDCTVSGQTVELDGKSISCPDLSEWIEAIENDTHGPDDEWTTVDTLLFIVIPALVLVIIILIVVICLLCKKRNSDQSGTIEDPIV